MHCEIKLLFYFGFFRSWDVILGTINIFVIQCIVNAYCEAMSTITVIITTKATGSCTKQKIKAKIKIDRIKCDWKSSKRWMNLYLWPWTSRAGLLHICRNAWIWNISRQNADTLRARCQWTTLTLVFTKGRHFHYLKEDYNSQWVLWIKRWITAIQRDDSGSAALSLRS